ncbi:MAG: pilus assembly protein PilP [Thermodesulfobacteriota bacterium]
MMHKRIYLIATVFLALAFCCLGCGSGSETDEPVIHVSKRVKIERPDEAAEEKAAEEKAEKAADKETARKEEAETAEGETETSEPAKETAPSKAEEKPASEVAEKQKPPEAGKADEAGAEEMEAEKSSLLGSKKRFYVKKGRVDPFEPFLHKSDAEQTSEDQESEIQRRKPRTPLERISLGQLELTAVMRLAADQQAMALVEDTNSKGYIVREGTYIGEKGGRVSDIQKDKIVIEEKYKDVFGKIDLRKIELKLQKRPGE